jgi:hypothetical protein
MAISQELRSRLVEVLRAFREERGEKCGWDRTFEQIEDEACDLGDAVAQALMAESLAEQAVQGPRELWAVCPRCQRPAKAEPDVEPRLLDTRRGQVNWQEPKHYCPRCRQSFFPAVPRFGD